MCLQPNRAFTCSTIHSKFVCFRTTHTFPVEICFRLLYDTSCGSELWKNKLHKFERDMLQNDSVSGIVTIVDFADVAQW